MKRTSGLLLFLTSWVPGCGQMYQGYMKRGLSLMLSVCLLLFFPVILRIGALAIFLVPAWLYAFFDSYNLRNLREQEMAPQDDWLFGLSDLDSQKLAALCRGRHSLIGWILVLLGVYALFDTVLGRLLRDFCEQTGNWWIYNSIMYDLPRLVVTVGIIALGIWFIRGPKQPKATEIPVFTPPVAEPAPVEEPSRNDEAAAEPTDRTETAVEVCTAQTPSSTELSENVAVEAEEEGNHGAS